MPSNLTGKIVSHYSVLELLGSGGMGVVYRALDRNLGRHVALKFISHNFEDDPIALRQFEREARTASQLNHPNICTVYAVQKWRGGPFIAMELLTGETIRQRLAAGPFDAPTVVDIGLQLASALGTAHEHGIVHRDVKPANVFMTPGGQVKLLDFGLAKELTLLGTDPGSSTGFTAAGRVIGTVNYMAPERLRGVAVDHRSDLFALGALFYEMITGRKAFEDDENVVAVIEAILQKSPRPLDGPGGPWPRGLLQIIETLLHKDPDDRYQSAAALGSALSALRGDLAGGRAVMSAPSAAAWRARASIAVLPFRNLSAEPDFEYFAEGLSEELIIALAKIDRVRVAAKASAFTFKARPDDVREIGDRLNVETVLSGTIQRSRSRIRVSCRLTSVADGSPIWSDRFDRETADVFALQDDIAGAIVDALRVTWVDRQASAHRHTENRESYHHYLRGRFYWGKRYEGGLKTAMEEFQSAIKGDPEYALAYAGMADAYAFLGLYSLMPPKLAFDKARVAAEQALALDAEVPQAHTSLGLVAMSADWHWPRAEAAFLRAVEIDRGQALAHLYYGWLLALTQRRTEAYAAIRKAQDADPLSPLVTSGSGWMHFLMRDYDQAVTECQKCVEVDPSFLVGLYVMAMAYGRMGRHAEALPLISRAAELSGRAPFYLALLGQVHAETGGHDQARAIIAELEARAATSYVAPHCFVYIHASLGDKDRAFEWQERACTDGAPPFYFLSPAIASLFDDPRHAAHLARMQAAVPGGASGVTRSLTRR
jgi:eukaryotic-like serine/threonine-protein kinase